MIEHHYEMDLLQFVGWLFEVAEYVNTVSHHHKTYCSNASCAISETSPVRKEYNGQGHNNGSSKLGTKWPPKDCIAHQKECGMIQRMLTCAMDPNESIMVVFQTKRTASSREARINWCQRTDQCNLDPSESHRMPPLFSLGTKSLDLTHLQCHNRLEPSRESLDTSRRECKHSGFEFGRNRQW